VTPPSEPHPVTGQPVGPKVDATPAQRPGPVTLEGRHGRVERLTPGHAATLWDAVKGHDRIWTYMSSYGPFSGAEEFARWVESRIPLEDPYSYAIVTPEGRAVGIATLMEIRPPMRAIEVGHIVYSPALQRSAPRRNICWRATPSRRSAIAATNGNATRSTRPRGPRRNATASSSRASCAST
jgi:hypothetical protein